MKKYLFALSVVTLLFTGCDDAQIASENLKKSADNFEIDRRVIFYNGITGEYMLNIEGKCSITKDKLENQLEVICKVSNSEYKKHFLGLSDNVTYFVEQLKPKETSTYHYRVTFKPQSIIPDIDFKGSLSDIPKTDKKD